MPYDCPWGCDLPKQANRLKRELDRAVGREKYWRTKVRRTIIAANLLREQNEALRATLERVDQSHTDAGILPQTEPRDRVKSVGEGSDLITPLSAQELDRLYEQVGLMSSQQLAKFWQWLYVEYGYRVTKESNARFGYPPLPPRPTLEETQEVDSTQILAKGE